MIQLREEDKNKLIKFVEENDLDYTIVNNGISKFSLTSEGITFYLYEYNGGYMIGKYDKQKDEDKKVCYDYFEFKTMTQVLEQLYFYDTNLPKTYYSPTQDSVNVIFDSLTYKDDWFSDFKKDDNWVVEDNGDYKFLSYTNYDYKPEVISPFNTLYEVSTINTKQYTKLDKLHFQIHPISLEKGNERYFFKLLCNNEEVLKEYINYNVSKKKGIKLLISDTFDSMSRFRI